MLNKGSLASVDAVLGCPMDLFEPMEVAEVAALSAGRRDALAKCALYAVNWTRELINAFATQTAPRHSALRLAVVQRLDPLLHLHRLLRAALTASALGDAEAKRTKASGKAGQSVASEGEGVRAMEPSALLVLTYRVASAADASDRDAYEPLWDPTADLLQLKAHSPPSSLPCPC